MKVSVKRAMNAKGCLFLSACLFIGGCVTLPSTNIEDGIYCNEISFSNSGSMKVEAAAAAGNVSGAQCVIRHLSSLDGGELEDAMVSLGRFAEVRPAEFLGFVRDGNLSIQTMGRVLIMLPLSTSDDSIAQLKLLEKRKRQLAKVNDDELIALRNLAVEAIVKSESEIRRNMDQ